MTLKKIKKWVRENKKETIMVFLILFLVCFVAFVFPLAYMKIDNYLEECKNREAYEHNARKKIISWFYGLDVYWNESEIPPEKVCFSVEISDYDVIKNILEWNEQGYSFLLPDVEGVTKEELVQNTYETIMGEDYYSPEEIEAITFMLMGNNSEHKTKYQSVLEIERDVFIKCIHEISQHMNVKDYSEELWWDKYSWQRERVEEEQPITIESFSTEKVYDLFEQTDLKKEDVMDILQEENGESMEDALAEVLVEKFPLWKSAEYIVSITREKDKLAVVVVQDVLLEEDNTIVLMIDKLDESPVITGWIEILNETPTYSVDYYDAAQKMLEKNDDEYAFELLLKKNADEVSDYEKEILALIYKDKCRAIEKVSDSTVRHEQLELVERFLESGYRTICKKNFWIEESYSYYDEQWIDVLYSEVEEDELAWQFLNQLGKDVRLTDEKWYISMREASVDVLIEPSNIGATISLNLYSDSLYKQMPKQSFYVTSERKADYYIRLQDKNIIDFWSAFRFTKEDISKHYLAAECIEEEQFVDCILHRDYKTAFSIDAELLGEDTGNFLAAYASKMEWVDDEQNCKEFENFLNALLYSFYNSDAQIGKKGNTYLDLLLQHTGSLRDISIEKMYAGTENRQNARSIAGMDVFWKMLNRELTENKDYQETKCMFWGSKQDRFLVQVKDVDIWNDAAAIDITLMKCNKEYCEDSQDGLLIYMEKDLGSEYIGNPQVAYYEALSMLDEITFY